MTAYLHHTYHLVNPAFFYELSFNPRRVLTKPSKPMHNDGHDNEDSDYILYVNDWLGAEEGNRYLILDVLGQGTFGQVVKCQNMKTREIVAVKVIKNKPAYFNQSMMEVTILEMLNNNWDPNDEHHILRLRDTFIHAKHLCLVFELLSSNLYELIKQNSFRGLSTSLVRVFTTQLLDALTVLHEARLIHCDLKPENILLKTLQTPSIKLVDFGSACHERQTVYTYIQSRFYRSPEVLLGLPYNASIDMWSLGTIAVELFLGLPLFPGTSEYNQVCRIVEMLGLPPSAMLDSGKQTGEFFNVFTDEYNRRSYKLKSLDQYSKEHNVQEQPSKRYFQATTLPDIIKTYPLARKSGKAADVQKEMANRNSFVDFVTGLLHMDPVKRWTPQQAKMHPFITGEKLTQPFRPPASPASPISALSRSKSTSAAISSSGTDVAKHPYGGLPQTPSRSSGKVYHDAAAYNQHLAQQQSYNSVHQARQQAPVINNPYAQDDHARAAEANAQAKAAAKTQAQVQQAQANAHAHAQAQAHAHAQAQAQAHAQAHAAQVQAAAMSPPYGQNAASGSTSYAQGRSRSNTMTRMDLVPSQMAKMGIEAGHSMTPIMNREESMREWERRQQLQANGAAGGQSSRQTKQQRSDYQQLDHLQQQADASHQSMYTSPPAQSWSQSPANTAHGYNSMNRMATSTTSPSGNHIQSPTFSVIVDAQQQQQQQLRHQSPSHHMQQSIASPSRGMSGPVTSPPSVYSSPNLASGSSRYQPIVATGQSTTPSSLAAFDPYTSDVAQLMTLQPTQYQGGNQAPPPSGHQGGNPQRLSMMMPQYSSALYAGTATSPTSPMRRSTEEGQYSPLPNQTAGGTYHHSQMPSAPQGGARARYG
jgi:dual specificity protein kinase YAK1